jgi:pilus assembly protein Flp/PilA
MTKLIKKFFRNEDGASAAEYALILAVIGGGIAIAAGALGTAVADVINDAAGVITAITIS